MSRRALLVCGVLSSLLYVGIDQIAAIRHAGYHDFASQTISELFARGAPTKTARRPAAHPLRPAHDRLRGGRLAVGSWQPPAARRRGVVDRGRSDRPPRPWLFPMNLRGVGGDAPHIVGTGVIVLFILTGWGPAPSRWDGGSASIRLPALVATLGFGALTSVQAKGLATGDPTPWIGITERLCVGAFLRLGRGTGDCAAARPARRERSGGRCTHDCRSCREGRPTRTAGSRRASRRCGPSSSATSPSAARSAPRSPRTGAARRSSTCGVAAARPTATRRGTKTRWSSSIRPPRAWRR